MSAAVMFQVAPEVRVGAAASEAAREATAGAARVRAVHVALRVWEAEPRGAAVVVAVAAPVAAVVAAVGGNQNDFKEKHEFTVI